MEAKEMNDGLLQEYCDLLKRESDFTARDGKSVTIREEYHADLSNIVKALGTKDISLATYIDRVLGEHIQKYRGAMNKVLEVIYKDNIESLGGAE